MIQQRKIPFLALWAALLLTSALPAQNELEVEGEAKYKLLSAVDLGFSITNSVGIGTFVSGYSAMPQWVSSFSVEPSMPFSPAEGWPRFYASASVTMDSWWLNSLDTSVYDSNHRIQFSDMQLSLAIPKIIEWSDAGVSLSASLPVTIAISAPSQMLNRLLAFSLGAGVKWSKGDFRVRFAPSARMWIHTDNAKTIDCKDGSGKAEWPWMANPKNPDSGLEHYVLDLAFNGDEETGASSQCRIEGRQTIATVRNSFLAAWNPGAHGISVELSYVWNFLRPLEHRPSLAGLKSSNSAFTQAVLGRIAYSYALPFYVNTNLTLGLTSYQGVFSKTGTVLFPFFDFETPNKNQTQVFVEIATQI